MAGHVVPVVGQIATRLEKSLREARIVVFVLAAVMLVVPARAAKEKPPDARVAIAGGGDLKFTTESESFEVLLQIEEVQRANTTVRVYVSNLVDSNGAGVKESATVSCMLNDSSCTDGVSLTALGSVPLTLTGKLPALGGYSTVVTLVTDKQRSSSRLSILRQRTPAPVDIEDVEEQLSVAEVAGTERNANDAADAYDRAARRWAVVQGDLPTATLASSGISSAVLLQIASVPSELPARASRPSAWILPDAGGEAKARLRSLELVVGLVSTAIAVMIGVQALDIGGTTWGSATDMIKALLWGLGINQAAGAAFIGLPGLQRELVKV